MSLMALSDWRMAFHLTVAGCWLHRILGHIPGKSLWAGLVARYYDVCALFEDPAASEGRALSRSCERVHSVYT
jgi:hypothetical protein